MTDPFQMLHEDHERVQGLFAQFETATDGRQKRKIFDQIEQEITLHSKIEEKVLYPLLEKKQETEEITHESYEEHHVVDRLLKETDKLSTGDDAFDAKIKVMMENVEHHVEEEEKELFPKARTVLSRDQIQKLATQIQEMKSNGKLNA